MGLVASKDPTLIIQVRLLYVDYSKLRVLNQIPQSGHMPGFSYRH